MKGLWNGALRIIKLLLKLLLLAGSAIATLWIFWTWLNRYVDPSIPQEKTELVRVLVESMIGVVVLIGLYYTWRRVTAAEKTVAATIEGQVTERFTRAIDQLGAVDDAGNKRLEVRLGGIYGLQQIAQDSDKFYWQIMEVLTAYIRMNAPAPLPPPAPTAPTAEGKNFLSQIRGVLTKRGTPKSAPSSAKSASYAAPPQRKRPSRVPPDIEAALLALAYRRNSYGQGEDRRLDLRRTDLRGADLSQFDFGGAWFDHSRLEGATLGGGDFREADFSYCHLEGANLGDAHLEEAEFSFAYFDNTTSLANAHLEGAGFYGAHLEGSRLYMAHLSGADFDSAHLEGAKFGKPQNWVMPVPEGANLKRVYFGRAHLSDTSFENADLAGADLRNADLRQAVGLSREQLKNAVIDDATLLPLDIRQG
jgi:uncharacterized protein YjbI with pentapeptide repeats